MIISHTPASLELHVTKLFQHQNKSWAIYQKAFSILSAVLNQIMIVSVFILIPLLQTLIPHACHTQAGARIVTNQCEGMRSIDAILRPLQNLANHFNSSPFHRLSRSQRIRLSHICLSKITQFVKCSSGLIGKNRKKHIRVQSWKQMRISP